MFSITVQYYMADTKRFTTDEPASVIASLIMAGVRHIEIASTKGD